MCLSAVTLGHGAWRRFTAKPSSLNVYLWVLSIMANINFRDDHGYFKGCWNEFFSCWKLEIQGWWGSGLRNIRDNIISALS